MKKADSRRRPYAASSQIQSQLLYIERKRSDNRDRDYPTKEHAKGNAGAASTTTMYPTVSDSSLFTAANPVSRSPSSQARALYRVKKMRGDAAFLNRRQPLPIPTAPASVPAPVPVPAPAIALEQVLGLTATGPTVLVTNPQCRLVAFTAGAVAVLYSVHQERQVAFISIGTGNTGPSDSASLPSRSSASSLALRPLTSLAFDASGQFLALGETGHHPRVAVWDCAAQMLVAELHGHKYGIASMAFSPDSSFVVSVGHQHDGFIYLWDWRSNQRLAGVRVASKIHSVTFDPLGRFFLTAGQNHAKFWTIEKGFNTTSNMTHINQKVNQSSSFTLEGRHVSLDIHAHSTFVDVAGSPLLSSATPDSDEAYLYAITSAGMLCHFSASRYLDKWVDVKMDYATSLDMSEKYIACGGANGCIRLFEPGTMRYLATLPSPHPRMVQVVNRAAPRFMDRTIDVDIPSTYPDVVSLCLMDHPVDGDRLVTIYKDNSLVICDITTPQQATRVCTMLFHNSCVWGIEPIPGNIFGDAAFGSCSADGTIRMWSMDATGEDTSGYKISSNVVHIMYVDDRAYHQSFGREDLGLLNIDSVDTKRTPEKLGIRCLKFSKDGRLLAVGDRYGVIRVYECPLFQEIATLQGHNAEVMALDFSTPGSNMPMLLASASRDRLIHVFDASTCSGSSSFNLVQTFNDHTSTITGLSFSHGGMRLVSCSADKSIIFRQLDGLSPDYIEATPHYISYNNVPIRSTVYGLAIERSSKTTVVITQDRRLIFMDTETGKVTRTHKPVLGSHDGGSRLGAGLESTVSSNNSSTLFINKIAIDPSGLFLAAASSDKCIRIFDFLTGACLGRAAGHGDLITSLEFIDGGRRVVSASSDGCIFVWRVNDIILQRMARGRLISPVSSPQRGSVNGSSMESSPVSITSTQIGHVGQRSDTGMPDSIYSRPSTPSLSLFPDVGSASSPPSPILSSSNRDNTAGGVTIINSNPSRVPSCDFAFEFDERDLPTWARSSTESMDEGTIYSLLPADRLPIPIKGPWAERLEGNAITLFTDIPMLEPIVAKTDSLFLRRRYSIESQSSPVKRASNAHATSSPSTRSTALLSDDSNPSVARHAFNPMDTSPPSHSTLEMASTNIVLSSFSQVDEPLGIVVHRVPQIKTHIHDELEDEDIVSVMEVETEAPLTSPDTDITTGRPLFAHELGHQSFEEYLLDSKLPDRPESRISISSKFLAKHSPHMAEDVKHFETDSPDESNRSSPIAYTETMTSRSATPTPVAASSPQRRDLLVSHRFSSSESIDTPQQLLFQPKELQNSLSRIIDGVEMMTVDGDELEHLVKTSVVQHTPDANSDFMPIIPSIPVHEHSRPVLQSATEEENLLLADVTMFKRLADKLADQLLDVSSTATGKTTEHIQDAMRYVNAISSHALGIHSHADMTKESTIKAILEEYSGILVNAVKSKLDK
ncbi:hypothetical protein BASA83_006000 [Batrachochytrium salamandrivorans]|nr:hypothetical protein BASA83_006000 [Batrachochytrium salamandrivorans]